MQRITVISIKANPATQLLVLAKRQIVAN